MATVEMTINTTLQTIDLGPPGAPLMANVETYNGTVPGPTIELEVNDTLVVRLINDLPHATGIHWHGIELQNNADGTPVTQNGVPGAPLQVLGNGVPAGGTYLYKFKVPRAGVFWYHPHHHHSTNRVFRGLYGMIVVTDPAIETPLVGTTLPAALDTHRVVLSDTTVCKTPGSNMAATYVDPTTIPTVADRPEWLSGEVAQSGPSPEALCEVPPPPPPTHEAMNEDGSPRASSFAADDIPNIQRSVPGRTVEGQTVLTNGVNVGGRLGTPANPGALVAPNVTQNVQPGQGIRLQIVNCAHLRYFRLRLTEDDGTLVKLFRVGGEGGILDTAILEGIDSPGPGDFDFKYDEGEIVVPPSGRTDIVAAIPDTATGTLTLWTRDYQRAGGVNPGNWAQLPSVPVMHFSVSGVAVPQYGLAAGAQLRPLPNPVIQLPAATDALLDPAVIAKPGMSNSTIELNAGGGAFIDGVAGMFGSVNPYTSEAHIGSTRYARESEIIELDIRNATGAHHPFHLHGFSFQPISLTKPGGPDYTWPYQEFRDTQDIPPQYTLKFRIDTSDRTLNDDATLGGVFGRWLFHCHIFFHAHNGMLSELVITKAGGDERPYVNVGGSWAYTPSNGVATRDGVFAHPDAKVVTLTASDGTVSFPPGASSGSWSWNFNTAGELDGVRYVYITATDTDGCVDQTVFRLKIGAPDDGSDTGDPHLRTTDGTRYDFQAVGEFILLRDREGLEVQTRQAPVETANPITDSYSGIKACVSVNTAVAARVGSHTIAYQPGRERGQLEFYVDGKPADLPTRGLEFDGHRVTTFDADGRRGLRIDYAHLAVVTVTPRFWTSHSMHYMNVSVSRTQGDEGIMGAIADGSWLPRLSSGATVGPKPASVGERYTQLYKTFADSWRLTDQSSLFVYAPGTSTATFADRDWPAEKPPCKMKPDFEIPGAPALNGMPIDEAKKVCQGVTEGDLFENCVFDVATTGDRTFADGYLFEQELRLRGTAVQVVPEKPDIAPVDRFRVIAIVSALRSDRPIPRGSVTFLVDDQKAGAPVVLDDKGRADFDASKTRAGARIRAEYSGEQEDCGYHASSSPALIRPESQGGADDGDSGIKPTNWTLIIVVLLIVLFMIVLLLLM
ncbi:MAG: multicopper oxidase domain-containing protein [Planctomycetota bacterium]|jgi:FtsP/CotA-like multicopper oxidase with cupredoxin domain